MESDSQHSTFTVRLCQKAVAAKPVLIKCFQWCADKAVVLTGRWLGQLWQLSFHGNSLVHERYNVIVRHILQLFHGTVSLLHHILEASKFLPCFGNLKFHLLVQLLRGQRLVGRMNQLLELCHAGYPLQRLVVVDHFFCGHLSGNLVKHLLQVEQMNHIVDGQQGRRHIRAKHLGPQIFSSQISRQHGLQEGSEVLQVDFGGNDAEQDLPDPFSLQSDNLRMPGNAMCHAALSVF